MRHRHKKGDIFRCFLVVFKSFSFYLFLFHGKTFYLLGNEATVPRNVNELMPLIKLNANVFLFALKQDG